MAQQSTTEPGETGKTTHGARTREQQKAVINKQEGSAGVEVDPHQKSLAEARKDVEQPAGEYDLSSDADQDDKDADSGKQ
jgi:hypothetical protein